MLIATTNELPGYAIEEVYGEVFGLTVRSRNIGSQIGAGLKSMFGGELKGMTKALVDSRNEVIERMVAEAEAKGGNAIVAMRFDTVRDGRHVDGDLRVRHGSASPQGLQSCPAPDAGGPASSEASHRTRSRRSCGRERVRACAAST